MNVPESSSYGLLKKALHQKMAERLALTTQLRQYDKEIVVMRKLLNGGDNSPLSDINEEKEKTNWQMAEAVLDRGKEPLHTNVIADGMEKQFNTYVNKKSLSQMLHHKASEKKIFFRVKGAKNTYGLLKWQQ